MRTWESRWEWLNGERAKVRLEGRFDKETVPEARKELLKRLQSKRLSEVTVDLSAVERMDTAGVALLVEMHNQVVGRGARWRVEGASSTARQILSLSRLSILLEKEAEAS